MAIDENKGTKVSSRQRRIDQIKTLLANNLIDVSLEKNDYDTCIDLALEEYRQFSSNALEESISFLTIREDVQDYFLPQETVEVEKIYRRGLSTEGGASAGEQFDPFTIAYTNIYLLQAGGQQGLLTFELYNNYLQTASRLFGGQYNFTWDEDTKRLRVVRHQQIEEEILLLVYIEKTEQALLDGRYSGPWLRDWALAEAKMILGQAYEKFSSIPTPQGGIVLNGATLKAEAQADKERLHNDIISYKDGGTPLSFIID